MHQSILSLWTPLHVNITLYVTIHTNVKNTEFMSHYKLFLWKGKRSPHNTDTIISVPVDVDLQFPALCHVPANLR